MAAELLRDGSLLYYIGISFYRVFVGWVLGSLIAGLMGFLPIGSLNGLAGRYCIRYGIIGSKAN